jgi:hypothetical protein
MGVIGVEVWQGHSWRAENKMQGDIVESFADCESTLQNDVYTTNKSEVELNKSALAVQIT